MRDAVKYASLCTTIRAAMITRGQKWRVVNLDIDTSRDNGIRVMEDVDVVGLRSLTINGVPADLVEFLNHVAALVRPELWHICSFALIEEESAELISEDTQAAYVRAVETLISAVARDTHLTSLAITFSTPLGRATLEQLGTAIGWSSSLISLELHSKFDTRADLASSLKGLLQSGWTNSSRPGLWTRPAVRPLPPAIVDLKRDIASELSKASQAMQRKIDAATTDDEFENVEGLLMECKRLAEALSSATRGAADDDDELNELDEELAKLIDEEPAAFAALQRVRTMFG